MYYIIDSGVEREREIRGDETKCLKQKFMNSSQALRYTRSRYTYLSKDTLRLSSFSANRHDYFLADHGLVIIDEKKKKKKKNVRIETM